MLEAIKRKYNVKNRFYWEAKLLELFGFGIGQPIQYEIDPVNNTITIEAVKESTKKVAQTTQKTKNVVPVIDLKASDVKAFFAEQQEKANELAKSGVQLKMYVEIVKGKIVLTIEEVAEKEVAFDNVISLEDARERKANVTRYAVSVNEFAKVVNYEQMTIFDLFDAESKNLDSSSVKTKLKEKAIRMLSLFSGAGTMDKGFMDQGYEIVFANDRFEKKALRDHHINTYRHNIGDHIVMKDVMELTQADIPEVDFLCAGIPCVTFSALNTINNFRDSESELHPIVEKTIDIIRWSKAKAFLFENVANFITVKKGLILKRLKERLADFGIATRVIEATELGSPQKRKRAFVLGIQGGDPNLEIPPIREVCTVKDAFRNVETAPQQDQFFVPTPLVLERMSYVPQGGNILDVPLELRAPNKKFTNFCQRIEENKQAPTITHVQDDVFFHPTKERYLSVRETARLFSLPDDFMFKGSLTAMFEMLKNAVDYKVSSFLAKSIKEQLQPFLGNNVQFI